MEALIALGVVAAVGWLLVWCAVEECARLRDELKAERQARNFDRLRDWEEVCKPASYVGRALRNAQASGTSR
jgi:hypothetical protein